MIRACSDADTDAVHAIINEAAVAYRGVIPADCWHEPYTCFARCARRPEVRS